MQSTLCYRGVQAFSSSRNPRLSDDSIHAIGLRLARWRASYALAAIGIMVAGLSIRCVRLGLPWTVAKYGGSIFWGMMVYCIVSAANPDVPRSQRAMIACVAAVLVESIRLFHATWLDDFRITLAGALLLGRIFSVWNIAAYATGIAVALWLDGVIRLWRHQCTR